jgi:serine/threonine-protein kinase
MEGKVIKDIRLVREIGGGGFGQVFEGEHVKTGETYAVKVLKVAPEKIEVLEREVFVLAELSHPNVLKMVKFGVDKELDCYLIITEWLPGRTLSQLWRNHPPFPRSWVRCLFEQLLDALSYAHEHNIIHRDLKPENFILIRDNNDLSDVRLKILDFGIAKVLEAGDTLKSKVAVGTPNYMAPEQVRGDHSEFGGWTDLYACGVILAELLTGRPMWEGEDLQDTMRLHLETRPPSLREMNPDLEFSPQLEALVTKSLAKRPEDRFQTAQEMLDALREAIPEEPTFDWKELAENIKSMPPAAERKPWPKLQYERLPELVEKEQKGKRLGLMVGGAVLLLGIATFFLFFWSKPAKKAKRKRVLNLQQLPNADAGTRKRPTPRRLPGVAPLKPLDRTTARPAPIRRRAAMPTPRRKPTSR